MTSSTPFRVNDDASRALGDVVKLNVERYLQQCGDMPPNDLYRIVMDEIEEPMLQFLMEKANNNQCKVTEMLGLARGTVRKKLKRFGMIGEGRDAEIEETAAA